jgi:hypothetical protein
MYALSTEKAPTIRPLGVRYPTSHLVLICGRYAPQAFFTAEPHCPAGSHLLVFV